ncbi:MAG: ADP-ribosylation factor-like protein [Candidatus Helarchaeota archaeon]
MALLKVVFLGIDNAGKSSILNIIEEKYSLVSNPLPTTRIERHDEFSIFGFDLISWDIPGQSVLREDYVLNMERTLEETALIIYVVDVQDTQRIDESIEFFNQVITKLRKDKAFPHIFVFLHKIDPDIKTNPEIIQNIETVKKELSSAASNLEVEFSKTTIYDRWTLFLAFSYALKKLLAKDKQLEVSQILREFAIENDLVAVMLLDEKNFLLNEYLPNPDSETLLQDLALMCTFTYKTAIENNLAITRVKVDLDETTLLLHPLTINQMNFFLLARLVDSHQEIGDKIDELVSKLSKIPVEYFQS